MTETGICSPGQMKSLPLPLPLFLSLSLSLSWRRDEKYGNVPVGWADCRAWLRLGSTASGNALSGNCLDNLQRG